jgi:hypothetical protein
VIEDAEPLSPPLSPRAPRKGSAAAQGARPVPALDVGLLQEKLLQEKALQQQREHQQLLLLQQKQQQQALLLQQQEKLLQQQQQQLLLQQEKIALQRKEQERLQQQQQLEREKLLQQQQQLEKERLLQQQREQQQQQQQQLEKERLLQQQREQQQQQQLQLLQQQQAQQQAQMSPPVPRHVSPTGAPISSSQSAAVTQLIVSTSPYDAVTVPLDRQSAYGDEPLPQQQEEDRYMRLPSRPNVMCVCDVVSCMIVSRVLCVADTTSR